MTARSVPTPVLVTGASGAVGRFVVESLSASGAPVVALSRSTRADRPGLRWAKAEITDTDGLHRLLDRHGIRRAIHLAAAILDCETDPARGASLNLGGTLAMLEASRRAGLERIVLAGTKAVFGPFEGRHGEPDFEPVREEYRREPISAYGLTKAMAEDAAAFYRAHHGLETVVVRFGTTCGPGKGPQHGGSAVLGRLVEGPARGLPFTLPQGGEQRDDVIYNGDVGRALAAICLAADPMPPVLHVGSGALITPRQIADAVRATIPEAEIAIGAGRDYMRLGLGLYCRMSTERLRAAIGFEPTSLADWVRDYIARVRTAPEVTAEA